MSELSGGNPRESLTSSLITQGLGYCCPAWFWNRFWTIPTDLIAARLGVSERTINRHRKAFNEGECMCEGKPNCRRKRNDTA